MAKNKKNKPNSVQTKLDTIQTIQEFGCLVSNVREKGFFLNEDNLYSLQNYLKKEIIPFEIPQFYKDLIESFSQLKDYSSALEERKKEISPKWLDQQTVDSLLVFAYSYLESRRITDLADNPRDFTQFATDFVRSLKPMLVYVNGLRNKSTLTQFGLKNKLSRSETLILSNEKILTQLSNNPDKIKDFLEIFEVFDSEDQFKTALTFFRKGHGIIFCEDRIEIIPLTGKEGETTHRIGEKYRLINNWYKIDAFITYELIDDQIPLFIAGETEHDQLINYEITLSKMATLTMLADWGIVSNDETINSLFIPSDHDSYEEYAESNFQINLGEIDLRLGINSLLELVGNIESRYSNNLVQAKKIPFQRDNPFDLILKSHLISRYKGIVADIVQYRTITETAEMAVKDMDVSIKDEVCDTLIRTLQFIIPNLSDDKAKTYQGLDVLPIFRLDDLIVLTHHTTDSYAFGPGIINIIIGELGKEGKLPSGLQNTFEERSLTQLKESLEEGFPGHCGFKFASEYKYIDSDGKDRDIDLIIYHEGYWLFIEHKWTDIRVEWQRIFSYCENQLEKAGNQLKITHEYIFSCANKFKNDISERWGHDASSPHPDNSYFLILSTSPEGDYQTYEGFPKVSTFELKVLLLQQKFKMMEYAQNLNDSAKIDELMRTTCFSDPEKPNLPELMQAIKNDYLWKDLIN